MNRGMKTALGLLLSACLALPLAGCRVRLTGQNDGAASGWTDAAGEDRSSEAMGESDAAGDAGADGEPGGETRENPEAPRREFDENAQAEIVAGTDRQIHGPGEGGGAPEADAEAEDAAVQLDGGAAEAAEQTVAAEQAEKKGVSEDAEAADSALTYFSVLLEDRLESLFECQRATVYWEASADHTTVHKSSPEHALILAAGCYDVSARLLEENLTVDDGWVARKNPSMIVTIVEGSVLGRGAVSTGAAKGIRDALLAREGWTAIDAVRSGRVLLLSEELMGAPYLQTYALLAMAKTANPELFADVDLDEALDMLAGEAVGTAPAGVYSYAGGS